VRDKELVRETVEDVRVVLEVVLLGETLTTGVDLAAMPILCTYSEACPGRPRTRRRTFLSRIVYIIRTRSASSPICSRYARAWIKSHSARALVTMGI
jgi:hypothetical protein